MADLSVQSLSTYLSARNTVTPKKNPIPNDQSIRAAIVILWGRLVYPQLDPEMKETKGKQSVSISEIYRLFHEHLGSKKEWNHILTVLHRLDYIRMQGEDTVTAGTRLWTAVDGSKLFAVFRSSVLARKLYQFEKNQSDET
jgi:hypothetical protein